MPLVTISFLPNEVSRHELQSFGQKMTEVVALAFDCPEVTGNILAPDEIMIRYDPMFDGVNFPDILVTIVANDFPKRRRNIVGRIELIRKMAAPLLPKGKSVAIWAPLSGGYVRFDT